MHGPTASPGDHGSGGAGLRQRGRLGAAGWYAHQGRRGLRNGCVGPDVDGSPPSLRPTAGAPRVLDPGAGALAGPRSHASARRRSSSPIDAKRYRIDCANVSQPSHGRARLSRVRWRGVRPGGGGVLGSVGVPLPSADPERGPPHEPRQIRPWTATSWPGPTRHAQRHTVTVGPAGSCPDGIARPPSRWIDVGGASVGRSEVSRRSHHDGPTSTVLAGGRSWRSIVVHHHIPTVEGLLPGPDGPPTGDSDG
jgi:hypothetical protein